MSTRTSDLGPLWYDFFGLCFTLVFCLLLIYCFIRGVDDFQSVMETKFAAYMDSTHKDKHRKLRRFVGVTGSLALGVLKVALEEATFWHNAFGLLVFTALLTASFWVGMFMDITLGLKILGFGVAGMAGLFIFRLLLDVVWSVCWAARGMREMSKRFESQYGQQ